jgi:hypothetical protein
LEKADHACVFFVAFLVALTTIPVSVSRQSIDRCAAVLGSKWPAILGLCWQNQKHRTMSRGFVLEKEEIQNKYGTQDSGA